MLWIFLLDCKAVRGKLYKMRTKFYPTEEFFNRTRPIPHYDGYRVDADGNVYSCIMVGKGRYRRKFEALWRQLNLIMSKGYACVSLFNELGPKRHFVHHLVLTVFKCVRPDGMWALHNDGNPANNNISNLRWDTARANSMDRFRHGTASIGSKCWNAKLDENKVSSIRELHESGVNRNDIATQFGISKDYVNVIVRRKTWNHLGK